MYRLQTIWNISMREPFLEEFQSNNKSGAHFKQYKKEKLVLL